MRRWRSGNVKGGECTCSAAAVAWAPLNVGFFLGLGRQYHEMSANERAVSHSHMGDRSSRVIHVPSSSTQQLHACTVNSEPSLHFLSNFRHQFDRSIQRWQAAATYPPSPWLIIQVGSLIIINLSLIHTHDTRTAIRDSEVHSYIVQSSPD